MAIQNIKRNSQNIIKNLRNEFQKIFFEDEYALYSWGSLARREMCQYSDIDIIILGNECCHKEKVIQFTRNISILYPNNTIDLLQKFSKDDLIDIARIDGGDRQAVTLAVLETKDNSTTYKFNNDIINNLSCKRDKIRELLHIMANLLIVYPRLFSPLDLKFGKDGLRYLNYAFLYAKYIFDIENKITDTRSAIELLFKRKIISSDLYKVNALACQYLLSLRNDLQNYNKSESNVINIGEKGSDYQNKKKAFNFDQKTLIAYKESINQLMSILFVNTLKHVEKLLGKKSKDIISNLLFTEGSRIGIEKLESNSEIMTMVYVYCTKNQDVLNQIYERNMKNWYIVFGIANNPYTSPDTLYNLVNPDNSSKELLELYKSYAWRNIYLYVAKNPSATNKTLKFIMNYENSRQMDINAARNNLKK